jgi:hypothetical protein
MIKTIVGFAVLSSVVIVPARAQEFPSKPEILNQIRISLIGERILRDGLPRSQTTTITSGGQYNSVSTTFDSTPPMPRQDLLVANRSVYDIKRGYVQGCLHRPG